MTSLPPINLYGKKVGRPLKPKQLQRLEEQLPGLLLDPNQPLNGQIQLEEYSKLWLEIGFGGGEHLAWQAARNPNAMIVGVEYFLNGVAKLLEHLETAKADNVRLYRGGVQTLLQAFEPQSIERVFVLHPDPWPKRRHHRRRLLEREFLTALHGKMKPGAELRIATDHADYLCWILREMLAVDKLFEWQAKTADDWRGPPDDWLVTRYGAKAAREGRKTTYLSFRALK